MIENIKKANTAAVQPKAISKHWPKIRLLVLALVIFCIYTVVHKTGLLQQADSENIRDLVAGTGLFGVLIYFSIFTIGQLLYIPGMVFVAAAALAFGQGLGIFYGMTGAAISITVSFFLVRYIGGTPLATTRRRWIRPAVARLDTQPFKSIFIMRFIFSTAPWLNYLLAMSSVSYRHYISASLLGIIPQAVLTVYFADWLIQLL